MPDPITTLHIDGAARGNPGPASYALVLARPGLPVVEEAAAIGRATNNVAEYTALVKGLERAAELGVTRLAVFSDSELLVKQMNGEYRVKHPDLVPLYQQATRLKGRFEAVTISHVRREQNARADALGNEALDGKRAAAGPTPTPARAPAAPPGTVSDAAVREDALAVLTGAARAWADGGPAAVPVEAVWDQLWSVLEEGGVLKRRK